MNESVEVGPIVITIILAVILFVVYKWKKASFLESHQKEYDRAVRELIESQRKYVLLNNSYNKLKKAFISNETNISPAKVGQFMDEYKDLHVLITNTLGAEAYNYILETKREETELLFTWILKKGYTVINTAINTKEPKLSIYDGNIEPWAYGSIENLYRITQIKQ